MLELVRQILVGILKVDVKPPEVPLGDHVELFRASDKHLTYLLVTWALKTGLVSLALLVPTIAAAVAVFTKGEHTWIAWVLLIVVGVGFVVVTVFGYANIRLDWEMRWYALTDRSLRIREGIVFMREVTLTLANVQELNVSQGPIQRALGITDLIVDTAGGGGGATAKGASINSHEGVLRGIDHGSDIRAKLQARVQQRRGAGLGDPDDHHDHHEPVDAGDPFVAALRALRDEAHALRTTLAPPTPRV